MYKKLFSKISLKFILIVALLSELPAHALINGKPLENSPGVVRLVFNNNWVCTGVFLNSTTILTAAHCIVAERGTGLVALDKVLSEKDELVRVRQIKSFVHTGYRAQSWHSHDLAIIKTSMNNSFKGSFKIESSPTGIFGGAILFGCGKSELDKDIRSRTTGENNFFRIGSILFFLGESKNSTRPGVRSTVAPNDSGAPVVDKQSGNIIGVAATTTVKESQEYGIPALSTATSTSEPENLKFITDHVAQGNSR